MTPRQQIEFQEQCKIFSLLRDPVVLRLHPELKFIYAYPAGRVFADKAARGKARAEGMQQGVPDIAVPIPRRGYNGLYSEQKSPTGKVSPEQAEFMAFLTANNYKTAVCRSAAEFLDLLEWYLDYKIGK